MKRFIHLFLNILALRPIKTVTVIGIGILFLAPSLRAAPICTETVFSNWHYNYSTKALTNNCAITFGSNVLFTSSSAQLDVTAPVIRLLPGTTISFGATVSFTTKKNHFF